jgi:hypothetical protein
MDDRQVPALGFLPARGKDPLRASHLGRVRRDNPSESAFDNACSGAGLHGCQLDAAMGPAKEKFRPANW